MAETEILLKHVESAMLETVRHAVNGITTADAAKTISYTPSGAHYVLQKLAERGLIKKSKIANREVVWMDNNGAAPLPESYLEQRLKEVKITVTQQPQVVAEAPRPPALVGREAVLEELINTEIRLRQLDDEFQKRREELSLKAKNLKATILARVIEPKTAPKQHTKKTTRKDQTIRAAQTMEKHGGPISIGGLAALMEVEHAVARGCIAELARRKVVQRQEEDGRYVLVVHADRVTSREETQASVSEAAEVGSGENAAS